jgi:hypothetical protein
MFLLNPIPPHWQRCTTGYGVRTESYPSTKVIGVGDVRVRERSPISYPMHLMDYYLGNSNNSISGDASILKDAYRRRGVSLETSLPPL